MFGTNLKVWYQSIHWLSSCGAMRSAIPAHPIGATSAWVPQLLPRTEAEEIARARVKSHVKIPKYRGWHAIGIDTEPEAAVASGSHRGQRSGRFYSYEGRRGKPPGWN